MDKNNDLEQDVKNAQSLEQEELEDVAGGVLCTEDPSNGILDTLVYYDKEEEPPSNRLV